MATSIIKSDLTDVENISNAITLSLSIGTVDTIEAYRKGREIQVMFRFHPSDVSSGRCVYGTNNIRPDAMRVYATSKFSDTVYCGFIDRGGTISIEPAVSAASSSHDVYFTATFLGNVV